MQRLQGLSGIDFIIGVGFFGEADERLNQLSGPLRDETEKSLSEREFPCCAVPMRQVPRFKEIHIHLDVGRIHV